VVTLPSPLKEVSRDRASEASMVTINKVSNREIRIKVKAFVITRVKKFVDIPNSPFFKLPIFQKIVEVKNQKRTNIKGDENAETGQHNKRCFKMELIQDRDQISYERLACSDHCLTISMICLEASEANMYFLKF